LEREQRKLSAIMSLDMVGYSRMIEADESGTLSRYKEITEQIIVPSIGAHNGRIFKTIGDGIMAEFNSAVDSVECGIEIQKLTIEKSNFAKDDQQISFRIGINLGDVIISGEDILGDGVNIASRVESLAQPGQVLISGSTFEQVNGKLDIHMVDCGLKQVKNINRSIHVYSIDPTISLHTSAKLGAIVDKGSLPVIAVLPFQNMSRVDEDEYFADGLTEDIITALSRFRELLVIARNSTFRYKGQSVDVSEIGRELNASYVLEGSIRRSANRARITAQLIKVADGTHVWADKYDRELEDIFDVQDELTQTIAAALGVRLQDAVREIAMRKSHADLNAYDCVLRSRRYTQTLNPEEHSMSRDLLEKAITLDPGYADAFAMLSNVYLAEYRFDANPRPNSVERSMEMAEKAT
jgi:adenylate cyclase